MFDFWILGMNARNMHYIKGYNDKKWILLADNKQKTKEFLSSRGIPTGTTYAMIRSKSELKDFSFDGIEEDDFVIKPNKGSKGKGIAIVRRVPLEDSGEYYYKIGSDLLTEKQLKYFLRDILDWRYSLASGSRDSVLIEEKLMPGRDFTLFCKYGLADIRVIVFGLVPVVAMVRVPTEKSWGKANLARGGIALGLNISTGTIEKLLSWGIVYTEQFPSPYKHFTNTTLPFWDLILRYSSEVQFMTHLGYLALDWVITEDGPKLLEINARAGLEVQNANLIPLKSRLNQVNTLKIMTPEKGVEIARTLFHGDTTSLIASSDIFELEEEVFFLSQSGEKISATLTIDLSRETSGISEDLVNTSKEWTYSCYRIRTGDSFSFVWKADTTLSNHTVALGQRSLEGYYISLSRVQSAQDEGLIMLKNLDQRLHALAKAVNLSRILKPLNYHEELKKFLEKNGKYDPIFQYSFPDSWALRGVEEQIDEIRDQLISLGITKGMAKLLYDKTDEVLVKCDLLHALRNQDERGIIDYNTKLYGRVDPLLLREAERKVKTPSSQDITFTTWLSLENIVAYVEDYLRTHELSHISVRIEKGWTARMSVKYSGNTPRIAISPSARIRQAEIDSILAHEVGVHLRRYQAWLHTGWSILKYGAAFYLEDEEGLAVYNSLRVLPEWEEKNGMYKKYIISHDAKQKSFRELVHTIESLYPEKWLEQIFSDCVRAKKGIMNTRKMIAWYMKDVVYLNGYTKIKNWVDNGGEIEKMFVWKVKVEDLRYSNNFRL